MTSPQTTTGSALREAAAALQAGRVAASGGYTVAERDKQAIHRDLAHVIDQLSRLLRAAGAIDAYDNSPASAGLHAVHHHLTAAADIARRRAAASDLDTPAAGHPRSWL